MENFKGIRVKVLFYLCLLEKVEISLQVAPVKFDKTKRQPSFPSFLKVPALRVSLANCGHQVAKFIRLECAGRVDFIHSSLIRRVLVFDSNLCSGLFTILSLSLRPNHPSNTTLTSGTS